MFIQPSPGQEKRIVKVLLQSEVYELKCKETLGRQNKEKEQWKE